MLAKRDHYWFVAVLSLTASLGDSVCSAAVWSHVSEVGALNGPHVSPVQWPPPQKLTDN